MMFQDCSNCFAFPSMILMGPISVKAPNCELAPGPPWSQMIKGTLESYTLMLWP